MVRSTPVGSAGSSAATSTAATSTAAASTAKAPAAKIAAKKAPAKSAAATPSAKAATKAPARAATKAPATASATVATKASTKAPAKARAEADAPAGGAGTEWTAAELKAVRAELSVGIVAMQAEYEKSLADLDELQQAGTDGAGDDQADAGSKTFDREQELSIAANRFDLMSQMMHAVERIDHGTYGYCEVCGNPIPRIRLQAFPMATLDVACKQREERR